MKSTAIPLRAPVLSLDLRYAAVNFYALDIRFDLSVSVFSIPIAPNIFEKINIFGMNYADKHWHRISQPEDEFKSEAKPEKSEGQNKDGVFVEHKKRGRKPKKVLPQPSIWDLLYPLLQPPLALGQYENLFLPNPPFPYQWQGIKFLTDNEHALLADDMGTGKTVMTLVALKILIQQAKVHHVLILCPPSVLSVWKSHLDDWAPELTASFIRGPQRETRNSLWQMPMHIYVTSYDMLRSDIDNNVLTKESFGLFDVVVFDEAHHIKNTKSHRFRAIKKLQPLRRWALTGTPVQNKLDDLASIFEFIYPGYITSLDLYPERIQEKIKPYFLRRRKQEVMPDLPPKQLQPFELDLDEEQEIAYRQAEAYIREELSALGNRVTKQHIFAKIPILKQICNFAPRKFSSPKTDLLKEQIDEIVGSGNKVIVFSQFVTEGVDKLEKILEPYGVAKIVGGQTNSNRFSEIERFKKIKISPS